MSALHLVENLDSRSSLLDTVIPWAEQGNGAILNQQTTEQLRRWIKAIETTKHENEHLGKILTQTPYNNPDESVRNRFWEAFTLENNIVLEDNTTGRFADYMSSLAVDESFAARGIALDYLQRIKGKLKAVQQQAVISARLIERFLISPVSDEKSKMIEILKSIDIKDENKKRLIDHLINWLQTSDDSQKTFAKQYILSYIN